jgi:hypothetical protein
MGKAFQAELWAVPVPTRSVTNTVLWRSRYIVFASVSSCLVPVCFFLKNAITDNSATLPGECPYSRRSIHYLGAKLIRTSIAMLPPPSLD